MWLPFEHATGDHSKQLKPCLYVIQNYWFPLKTIIGRKIDCWNLIYLYCREKTKQLRTSNAKLLINYSSKLLISIQNNYWEKKGLFQQLKTSKTPRSFP